MLLFQSSDTFSARPFAATVNLVLSEAFAFATPEFCRDGVASEVLGHEANSIRAASRACVILPPASGW